jgi:predicted nucleic acid-binding protein
VIACLDASALVKRHIVERGSRETIALTADTDMTSIVSRAEVAAAVARAVREGLVKDEVSISLAHARVERGEIIDRSNACHLK